MSKKSRKQRLRKREKTAPKAETSEGMLKKLNKYAIRKEALNYLSSWNDSISTNKVQTKPIAKDASPETPQTWKFQKSKQVWLLRNMFHLENVPAKHFKIMINYIDSIKGQGRKAVIEQCRQMLGDKSKMSWDPLETQLINEAEGDERKELKSKIETAKVSRIEKIAAMDIGEEEQTEEKKEEKKDEKKEVKE